MAKQDWAENPYDKTEIPIEPDYGDGVTQGLRIGFSKGCEAQDPISRKAQHTKDMARVQTAIGREIAVIEQDERYHYKSALVEINAPLALLQCGMEAKMGLLLHLRQAFKDA